MIPVIDKKATGVNIRRTMDRLDLSVRDLQAYLGLNSLQSIYHWLNGICLPTVDNLYALSGLFHTPVDNLLCGSLTSYADSPQFRRSLNSSRWNRTVRGIWWHHCPLTILGLHRMTAYR